MNAFHWKLILQLSLFGFAMSIATVFWIPPGVEPFFWLAIFIICAVIIAKQIAGKYFLHGFLVSLVNCVWVTSAHVIFFNAYLAHHAQETSVLMRSSSALSPRLLMALTGPVIGIISGLALGLFAFAAGKLLRKTQTG